MNITFEEDNIQSGQYNFYLEGDFQNDQRSEHLLQNKLFEVLRNGNLKIIIVHAKNASISSPIMQKWAGLVIKYFTVRSCQAIYMPSQLMMCMKYDGYYTSKRPNDVFIEY